MTANFCAFVAKAIAPECCHCCALDDRDQACGFRNVSRLTGTLIERGTFVETESRRISCVDGVVKHADRQPK